MALANGSSKSQALKTGREAGTILVEQVWLDY